MTDRRYKLLVVDVDGTILDRNGVISEKDRQALSAAVKAGVKVSLCTGRVVQAARNILARLGLNGYHIFFDGALVYNPETEEEVYADPIGRGLLTEAVDYAHNNGLDIDLYSVRDYFVERETWATAIRRDFFDMHPLVSDFGRVCREERIIKGSLVVQSPEEKRKTRRMYADFKNRLHFSWTHTPAYPDVDFINVLAPDVSKANALRALIAHFGISTGEVMAIGDGPNDIPLLEAAGLAVAVGNASDEVKAVADHVTLDVEHSGVAAAVEKFLL